MTNPTDNPSPPPTLEKPAGKPEAVQIPNGSSARETHVLRLLKLAEYRNIIVGYIGVNGKIVPESQIELTPLRRFSETEACCRAKKIVKKLGEGNCIEAVSFEQAVIDMPKLGTWWLKSDSNPNWNYGDRAMCSRKEMPLECKQKLEEFALLLGESPDDLEWGYERD